MRVLTSKVIVRNDTEANWLNSNRILLEGELALSKDSNGFISIKSGDGSRRIFLKKMNNSKLSRRDIINKGISTILCSSCFPLICNSELISFRNNILLSKKRIH